MSRATPGQSVIRCNHSFPGRPRYPEAHLRRPSFRTGPKLRPGRSPPCCPAKPVRAGEDRMEGSPPRPGARVTAIGSLTRKNSSRPCSATTKLHSDRSMKLTGPMWIDARGSSIFPPRGRLWWAIPEEPALPSAAPPDSAAAPHDLPPQIPVAPPRSSWSDEPASSEGAGGSGSGAGSRDEGHGRALPSSRTAEGLDGPDHGDEPGEPDETRH